MSGAEIPDAEAAPAGRAPMRPAERLAALGFLLASTLCAAAFLTPLDAGPSPAPEAALAVRPRPSEPGRFLAAVPFDPARRAAAGSEYLPAPAPPPAEPAPAAEPPGAPILAGVLVAEDGRKATFEGSNGAWQAEGSLVQGWTLATIEPGAVVLTRDGETRRLRSADALR